MQRPRASSAGVPPEVPLSYVLLGAGLMTACVVGAVLSANSDRAVALPSYARQTGQPCATCHNGAFPQLTPYGREFKLNGYTAGGTRCRDTMLPGTEQEFQIPISFMLVPTFTHTRKEQPDLPVNRNGDLNGLKVNNNSMLQDSSVFFGGQIYCKLGAFVQATYDRPDQAFFLDNTDIRYADKARIAGVDVVYGLTLNNNPTVEDPWNTTPAWRIPGGGSLSSAFAPGPITPLIENLGGIVAGGGGYVFLNNTFYAAFSSYGTLDAKTLQTFGEGNPSIHINGLAPYWRLAIERSVGPFSFMVGTYGMQATLLPDITQISPPDKITDVGFDTQFQYLSGVHFFTARASYTNEWAKLDGSVYNGTSVNPKNHLQSLNLSGTYSYDSRFSLTLGHFVTKGSTDFDPDTGTSYFGTFNGSPNARGEVVDFGYSPWSKGGPSIYPWLNTRIGVQYWHYDKMNGAKFNYDGNGRDARDDDTLLLYSWTAF